MIVPLTHDHVDKAVDLHHRILHWSINARLGRAHLAALYRCLIDDPDTAGFVDIKGDGTVLSCITITRNPERTRKAIFRIYSFRTLVRLFFQSLAKPADFIDLLENKFRVHRLMKKMNAPAELLTWVGDTATLEGRVSGVRIMQHAIGELAKEDLLPAFAQVARYDPAPNKFHKNAGNRLVYALIRNNLYLVGTKKQERA